MPSPNDFRHQEYRPNAPDSLQWISQPQNVQISDPSFSSQLLECGRQMQQANVVEIWLIHGTFAGNDAFGLVRTIGRVWPALAEPLLQLNKRAADTVFRDMGNYSGDYAKRLEASLGSEIGVTTLNWSGENNHVGRAEGAIRLLDKLMTFQPHAQRRVLLLSHSHGGNVVALATNLLAASQTARRAFFTAALPHYFHANRAVCDIPAWKRVRSGIGQLQSDGIDVATFGCPVRYGWDRIGCGRLLHFLFHVPQPDRPAHLVKFPPNSADMQSGASGDVIQQIGVAGTNFAPHIIEPRSWLAENRLNRLLQKGIRRRDLLKRLMVGVRCHDAGHNLLIDYRPSGEALFQHMASHTVYTSQDWMAFHMQQIVSRFYDASTMK